LVDFGQRLNIGQIDPESDDETSFHLKSSRLFAIRATLDDMVTFGAKFDDGKISEAAQGICKIESLKNF
jgi:hypothetical protein